MPDSRLPLPDAVLPTHASGLDEARERAIRLLTDGFAYDVITVEEFEWRLGQMSHAADPRAIDALVADLGQVGQPGTSASISVTPIAEPEGRILGIMSEVRRHGPWRVPQRLRVKAIMSDVKIDLRYAHIPPGCTIEVSSIMANVSFIVRPGMVVDFDVLPIMAAAGSDPRAEGSGFTVPQVRVRGKAIMSEVRVRVRELGR
jgi:hypothetical protein